MKPKELPLFSDKKAREALRRACRKNKVTIGLVEDLLNIQREFAGRGRQYGITEEFRSVIGQFLEEREG